MYNIEQMDRLADKLSIPAYDEFPDIELYMDQVLDFLSRSHTSLRKGDKLSSAMVNNYIKAELLPRAKGKKYSRTHLAHLTIIQRLKHTLSVKDTGTLMSAVKDERSDKEFYEVFRKMVDETAGTIAQQVINSSESLPDTAMRMAVWGYLSRVASEYILDFISKEMEEKEEDKEKDKDKEKKKS